VNLGFQSFLERRAATGEERLPPAQTPLSGRLKRYPFFSDVSLAWETLNYTWDTRVLSFDAEEQQLLLSAMQFGDSSPFALLARIGLATLVLVALYVLCMRLRIRSRGDRVRELYDRFCEKAARAGARRLPTEGPENFARRAAEMLPDESERIREITDAYVALRYSARPAASLLERLAVAVTAFGRSVTK
jgi:hypothetical protein